LSGQLSANASAIVKAEVWRFVQPFPFVVLTTAGDSSGTLLATTHSAIKAARIALQQSEVRISMVFQKGVFMDKHIVLASLLAFLLGGCVSKSYESETRVVAPTRDREAAKERVIIQEPAPRSDTTIIVPR
jgi:hypothetical protein